MCKIGPEPSSDKHITMRRVLLISGIGCLLGGLGWGAMLEMQLAMSGKTLVGTHHAEHYYEAVLQSPVDSICVVKHQREMLVFREDSLLKVYRIALGDTPMGHKHFQGDERTPEGLYRINDRNPNSSCHKNLGISYPNNADRAYARSTGKPTGGDIKIHGLPNGQGYIGKAHVVSDWTNGCVGITDEEVDELYKFVRLGSPILILP